MKDLSQYHGVSRDPRYNTYRVNLWVDNKLLAIGSFKDPQIAGQAYDRAALFYLQDPNLNFPQLIKQYIKDPYNPEQARGHGKSRYTGVSWVRRGNKWQAKIRVGLRIVHIGYYKTEQEAAIARDQRALELLGPTCKLNFPGNV